MDGEGDGSVGVEEVVGNLGRWWDGSGGAVQAILIINFLINLLKIW